jgi:hypothetical protein
MTKHKHQGRKTERIVRTPATRFAHLRKRQSKGLGRLPPKIKK